MGRAAPHGGPGGGGAPLPRAGPAGHRSAAVLLRRRRPRLAGTGDRRDAHRPGRGRAARPDIGPLAGPGRRPYDPGRLDPGRVDADLLDGAHPPALLLPAATRAARRRRVLPRPAVQPPAHPAHRVWPDRRAADRELADVRQHPDPSRAARRGDRRLPGGPAHADDPGAGPGHRRRRPRADGPRAGLSRAGRVRPLRHEAGLEPGRRGDRPGVRLLARQHLPGRGDLRLAGPRQLRYDRDREPRQTRHSGGHPVHRPGLRGRQPGRGHHPGRHRPEDPAAMIEAPSTLPAAGARLPRGETLRRGLAANPLLVAGGLMSALILVVALLAPLLAPFPADAGTATHPFLVLHPPSALHWFGTDNVGRDIYSRVLYGARISPLIAVIVLVLACAIGIPLGVAAGYFGGWLDEAIMRETDIFLAFPSLLLA